MPILVLAVLGRGVVDPDSPVAAADDLGLTRGDGCFEGCRLRRLPDGSVVMHKPEAHLARFRRSAAALEIAFDEPGWRELIDAAAAAWVVADPPAHEAAVKLVLTRGRPATESPAGAEPPAAQSLPAGQAGIPTGYLTVSPVGAEAYRQRRDGVRGATMSRGFTADAFADAPWLLGGVKTLSYAVNMAAQREAVRRGADDALFVSVEGQLLESPASSIVWAVGRTLATVADGATGILGSTTMHLLFERAAAAGWTTVSTAATLADLEGADAVFLVGSVRGVVQVVSIDGRPLAVTDTGRAVLQECRELTDFA